MLVVTASSLLSIANYNIGCSLCSLFSGQLNLEYWVLWGEENQMTAEKVSEQGQEPTTNSTPMWCQVQESNPGHGGGRQALSPQSYPCSLLPCKWQNESSELTTTGSIILEKTVHTDNVFNFYVSLLTKKFGNKSKDERKVVITPKHYLHLIISWLLTAAISLPFTLALSKALLAFS